MDQAPQQITEDVRRELAGESILWAGSPSPWAYASRYWATAAFGIPFLAFSVFWTYQATNISHKADAAMAMFFPLWGLMFVGVGLVILLSPFFMAWRARSVYYVVTARRAVIFEKVWKLTIRSFNPAGLVNFERVSNGGIGGSIVFQRVLERSGRGSRTREIGFIGLKDYAPAERAMNQLVSSYNKT